MRVSPSPPVSHQHAPCWHRHPVRDGERAPAHLAPRADAARLQLWPTEPRARAACAAPHVDAICGRRSLHVCASCAHQCDVRSIHDACKPRRSDESERRGARTVASHRLHALCSQDRHPRHLPHGGLRRRRGRAGRRQELRAWSWAGPRLPRRAAWSKCPPCVGSVPARLLCVQSCQARPEERPAHWAPSHCLRCVSEPPPNTKVADVFPRLCPFRSNARGAATCSTTLADTSDTPAPRRACTLPPRTRYPPASTSGALPGTCLPTPMWSCSRC